MKSELNRKESEAENKLRQKLEPGQLVRLDAEYTNSSIVAVVSQSPKRLYTEVKDEDESWQVMTVRLTPIAPPRP